MFEPSFWDIETHFSHQDVIIVGSGFMGLWTALALKEKEPNLTITIIEKGPLSMGASTRNAGFACFGSPTELLYDINLNGENTTLAIAEKRYKGLEKIKNTFPSNEIQFNACGGYECINKNYPEFELLNEKIHYLNKILNQITKSSKTYEWANTQMSLMGLTGFNVMIKNNFEGSLHSGFLAKALLKKIHAAGIAILNGVEVLACEQINQSIHLRTNLGTFTTNQAVIASNAFITNVLPNFQIEPARGQIIITAPIPNLSLQGTFHFDEGFYYWRNVGNRILLGGARNLAFDEERTTDLSTSQRIIEHLTNFLKQHIIPLHRHVPIEYQWSGIMGFSKTKQPIMQRINQNLTVAFGCNGMGVALTPILGTDIANIVLGKSE